MKTLKIHKQFQDFSVIGRLIGLTMFFTASNQLDIEWGLINSAWILTTGMLISAITGDVLGLLFGGLYLCRTGKAGEVDRWSRFKVYRMPWRIWAQSYLRSYSSRRR